MRHQTIQNWINTEVKYRNVKLVKNPCFGKQLLFNPGIWKK